MLLVATGAAGIMKCLKHTLTNELVTLLSQ